MTAETVLHAYGVLGSDDQVTLPQAGIGGATVVLVTADSVAALVSELPADRYGPESWRAHAEDPVWLGEVAEQHNAVLQSVAADTDVLPLRLPAVYANRAELNRVLGEDSPGFEAALAEIRGHVEWGAKVFATREPAGQEEDERPTSGRDYLQRKASQADRRERAVRERQARVLDVHEALALAATHAVVNSPQDRALSGRQEPMLLNAAYLVPRAERDGFLDLAERLGDSVHEAGMFLEISGPWPAYNFAGRSGHPATGAAP